MRDIDQDGASRSDGSETPSVRFVTRYYDNPAGGLGRYERELVQELSSLCNITVVPAEPWPLPRWFIRAARTLGRDLETVLREHRAYVRGPRRGSIFHLSSQELASSLFWQRYKAPTVVTVHDIIPLISLHEPWSERAKNLVERAIVFQWKRGLRRADHLIAVSNWTKRLLVDQLRIPEERISVVYQSVDPQVFNDVDANDGKELSAIGLGPDDRFLLHVGSLHPRKDIPTLVRALAIVRSTFPDVKLVLAGGPRIDPGAKTVTTIQAEIRRLGLEDAVIGTGKISDQALAALYRRATATVLPSRYEGFGYPVVEAMACGCPVIASDASCLPEIVGDAGLLFPVGDAEGLAEKIVVVISEEVHAHLLREQGKERAAKFGPNHRARDTVTVYEHLLNEFARLNGVTG